jgi:hypothetical protein
VTEPTGPGEWRRHAHRFAEEEIRPRVDEMERSGGIPAALRAALGEHGFMGLTLPREFGGAAASTRSLVAVLTEIARASASVATLLSVHLSVAAAPIATSGTPEQKERYLPRLARGEWLGAFALTEPGVGSDPAHMATTYRLEESGYRVQGTKTFITNGASADLLLTFATRDPALGNAGVTAFLLPRGTAGFQASSKLDKLGLRSSETTQLEYVDVHLPLGARLGLEGEGLRIALKALTDGRVGIAACALGVAEAALDDLVAAGKVDPSDRARAIAGAAYTEVLSARALVELAADLKDQGEPFRSEASAAKLHASRVAVRTAHAAFDARGTEAAREGSRAGRLLRDARVFPIVEGTSEIQELILGRALLGDE